MWELKELTFILSYSEYSELMQEKSLWAENLDNIELSKRYPKRRVSFSQVVIPGTIPDVRVEFFEEKDKDYKNPVVTLGIDVKSVRFMVRPLGVDITNYDSYVQQYLSLFLDFWQAFNGVAQVNIIERIGLVLIFVESSNVYKKIKRIFLRKEPHYISQDKDAVELRFSEFVQPYIIDKLKIFKNTLIAPNVFLIPKYAISAKNKEANRAEVQAIFDIACLPSSRGIIDSVDHVEEAFKAFIWLANSRISWFREVMELNE